MGWISALFPGRLWAYVAVALSVFAAGAGSAWQVQQWRFNTKELDRAKQELVDVEFAAKEQFRKQERVLTAQNAARAREARLRADADAGWVAVVGVQRASTLSVQRAKTDHAACLESATSLKVVFDNCSREYQTLGDTAQRHVSDIQTLDEAWPQ